jgi:hypothetical protein
MTAEASEFEVVSLIDPAIAWPKDEYATYRKYRETRDIEVVRPCFKPGVLPTIFVVRELPNSLRRFIKGDFDDKSRAAFQHALVRVENFRDKDRGPIVRELDKWDNGTVKDDELALFTDSQILEIGSVALQRGFFPSGTGATYQLPPTLLEQWAAMVLLPAA